MQTVTDELETKTRAYWVISMVRNGKMPKVHIEFWEASEVLQEIQQTTNFVRPIMRTADKLMQDLIRGEPNPPVAMSKILVFARKN